MSHGLSILLSHRSCISFEIKVRLTGTILADDLVKTTILGDFQKIGDKLCSAAEGAIPLTYPPFLPILTGPVNCCYVEGTWGEVVSYLEQGLQGLQPLHPDFPKWESLLPIRGAWGRGLVHLG